jgi:hypothetical protein
LLKVHGVTSFVRRYMFEVRITLTLLIFRN